MVPGTVVLWPLRYKLVKTHFSGTKKFITYNPESKPFPVDSARPTHGLPKLD